MSESRNDRIREAVNIIESAEGARDRMLANIKRKAAEQAAGEDIYSTPALEKNIPFKRFVKWLIPIAACFVIVVIGTAERQKTNITTDPLSETTNPFAGVDNTVESEPVYAEIIPRSVEECVNDIPNIVQGECLQVTPHQNGVVADEDVIQAFNTFQEFEENEKKQNDGMSAYYVPAVLGEQCSLIGISKREGVYLATSYQVFTQTIHPNANTAYEKELVGSILCTQYLFPVTNETISFFQRNFQEIYYNDSLYYYTESRSLDKSDLLGYEISFIIDQTAFHIHLPAVNSFEEMMQYTKLVKRVIE